MHVVSGDWSVFYRTFLVISSVDRICSRCLETPGTFQADLKISLRCTFIASPGSLLEFHHVAAVGHLKVTLPGLSVNMTTLATHCSDMNHPQLLVGMFHVLFWVWLAVTRTGSMKRSGSLSHISPLEHCTTCLGVPGCPTQRSCLCYSFLANWCHASVLARQSIGADTAGNKQSQHTTCTDECYCTHGRKVLKNIQYESLTQIDIVPCWNPSQC